ncbi:proteasome inhibitor PI31 subunit-like [Rhinoderma darwinii]|uniref:proteasome inhibitor PI31 subunit n=1 Tax=Rhinoderma darwinii TaxID=43563 RepID=UPI003F66E6A8
MASPGLELLLTLVSPDITRPQDPLVCFIHWELISHGLRCLGISEQAGAQETGTERLPDGWANNKELYTLRYGHGISQILLKALTVEGTVIINAMELQSEKVSDVTLNIEDFIDNAHLKQYPSVYKNPAELKRQLEAKLLSPLLGAKKETVRAERVRDRPAHDDPLRVPTRAPASHHPPWTDPPGHFPYGAADLDPLGVRSGGMIMDPFQSGRTRPRPDPLGGLPSGAVPPGARFDPFGPIGSGRPTPDPDHLPPPGYDDMFM